MKNSISNEDDRMCSDERDDKFKSTIKDTMLELMLVMEKNFDNHDFHGMKSFMIISICITFSRELLSLVIEANLDKKDEILNNFFSDIKREIEKSIL
jgi:hypothetical protein